MPRDLPRSRMAPARLIGADTVVPCLGGRSRRYVNLDYAASTPVMAAVWEAVEAFLPWYSSVHRGSGLKSQVSTAAFEDARETVAGFVGARAEDAVVFVRNTTEAINVLSAALPEGTRVLSSPVEHHSNMLPWRRHHLRLLPFTGSPDELLDACRRALRSARPRIDLVAVTGASNVTGEVWPVAELAELAHAHGAELCVDAAQLAPHRPIDMTGAGIDFLALSGHKLYAPFGTGALVGDRRRLRDGEPLLHGGGAIELVTPDDVIWADAPQRHEAGSPNVVGSRRARRGLPHPARPRDGDRRRTRTGACHVPLEALTGVPGLRRLTLWPDSRRPRRRRHVQPRRLPPSAAGRRPERRARDRRSPRLLLRAPTHHAAAPRRPTSRSTASPPSCGRDGVRPSREPSGRASGSAPRRTTSTG